MISGKRPQYLEQYCKSLVANGGVMELAIKVDRYFFISYELSKGFFVSLDHTFNCVDSPAYDEMLRIKLSIKRQSFKTSQSPVYAPPTRFNTTHDCFRRVGEFLYSTNKQSAVVL